MTWLEKQLSVITPAQRDQLGNYPSRVVMLEPFTETGAAEGTGKRAGHFVLSDGPEPATAATTVDGRGQQPIFTESCPALVES